jgi:hypothetical protein
MAEPWLKDLDQVDSARLVDLLERIHRDGVEVTPELAAEELSRLGDQRSREGLYASALDHFSKEERRLKVQAEVTTGLLQKLRERHEGGVTQRLLRLRAEPGQPFKGRFRVDNDSGKRAEIQFLPRFDLAHHLDPSSLVLEAHSGARVSLSVEEGLPAGEFRELLVDVAADGVLRMKLWVELRADAA